jgi:hypothetical protein
MLNAVPLLFAILTFNQARPLTDLQSTLIVALLGDGGSREISDGQGEVGGVLGEKTSKSDVEGDESSDDTECASGSVDRRLSAEFARHPVKGEMSDRFLNSDRQKETHKRMKVRSRKKNKELSAIEAFQVDTKKICGHATVSACCEFVLSELNSRK